MNTMIGFGLTQLFRGARRGQALTAGFGAAITLIGLARRYGGPEKQLLYSRTLKDGEKLTIRLRRGEIES